LGANVWYQGDALEFFPQNEMQPGGPSPLKKSAFVSYSISLIAVKYIEALSSCDKLKSAFLSCDSFEKHI